MFSLQSLFLYVRAYMSESGCVWHIVNDKYKFIVDGREVQISLHNIIFVFDYEFRTIHYLKPQNCL